MAGKPKEVSYVVARKHKAEKRSQRPSGIKGPYKQVNIMQNFYNDISTFPLGWSPDEKWHKSEARQCEAGEEEEIEGKTSKANQAVQHKQMINLIGILYFFF